MHQAGDTPSPTRTVTLLFGVGSLGTGIYLTVPSILLLYFLTDVHGISPFLAGLAVFVPRAYDILVDPVMGWISDRTRSRLGRRRPYLLAGALGMAVTFVFLFNVPQFASTQAVFWYVLVVYALSATAYSVFAVPYLAMPSEMSRDPHVRTGIMATRMGFAMTGILIGAALAPWLVASAGGGREGFAHMSWIVGLISAVAMLAAFFGTRNAPVIADAPSTDPIIVTLNQLRRDRSFARLGLAYVTQLTGMGCFNAAAPYFVVHVMQRGEGDIGFLFACLLGGSITSMPGWSLLSRKSGKRAAYAFAVLVTAIGTAGIWMADEPASWWIAVASAVVMGIGFGGAQLLPFSLLSDVINESNAGSAGAYTGAWTAIEKIGLAVGPLIVGAMLSLAGLVKTAEATLQPADVLLGIRACMAAIPALLVIASLPLISMNTSRKTHGMA
jgi:Na+/melibiose symporter-like transporter